MHLLKDTAAKRLLRQSYITTCGARAVLNAFVPRRRDLSVYYGGARSGDVGGPLVKVKILRKHFAEVHWGYNLVYVLSNAPYLPGYALRLLKHRNVPIVHNQNGVFYKAWYQGDWEGQNRRMARAYHMADWVFYQSEFCRRAADRFLGRRDGQGEILYNAVDTNRYTPTSEPRKNTENRYRFLVTGKIGSHLYYRLESSISGLRAARDGGLDAEILIAGWVEDAARSRAAKLAADLGIADRVRFTGVYTQQQAPEVYRAADAYVMTKHNDPCPNTVLEALATGLPVLYSNSGGVPELVGTEAGVGLSCVEDWDTPRSPTADAVGEGMLRIAANHNKFSATARRRAVECFDLAFWINRHRTVFETLLAQT